MPKYGMEPIRRSALIDATIREIGRVGSLDVTVSQIARRAGMSSALAHHYFGSKDRIFLAAMRQILTLFGDGVRARLAGAHTPRERLDAIIEASFADDQFDPDVIAAWLVFYVQAQTSDDAARLLRVYRKRLHTNLVACLVELVNRDAAEHIASTLGALIDGVYLRHALQDLAPSREQTLAMVTDYLDLALAREGRRKAA
ncbi:choline-binding transcriptional repressor BetI [Oricola thermophila]|uniref:HTH-type transcriptional regulator BetI n=1 Tax=Oricola thermophila TaxID=2742145 RepID=A0A6N1VEG2_9HYPH|nr:transcriptional regulator BetI [Oricola thermophila]QKV17612.1 transcriptional regulator BetI [Oricola thermophila]